MNQPNEKTLASEAFVDLDVSELAQVAGGIKVKFEYTPQKPDGSPTAQK
jgi:hypothetical protein